MMAASSSERGGVTPEEAGAYLSRTNWKALMEWLTAEAILHRPCDPLTFIKDLTAIKLKERSEGYSPEDATTYLQECYNDAASTADVHGRIYATGPGPTSTSEESKAESSPEGKKVVDHDGVKSALEAALRVVGDLSDLDATKERVASASMELLGAERGYVFLKGEMTSAANLAPYKGIIKAVEDSGSLCIINDAANDARFDREADKTTGVSQTRNVLCCPMTIDQELVGTLQVVNQKKSICLQDEETLLRLGKVSGHALRVSAALNATKKAKEKAEAGLDLIRGLVLQQDFQGDVAACLEAKLPKLIDCDICSIFLLSNNTKRLLRASFDEDLTTDAPGFAAACAREQQVIRLSGKDTIETDPRFSELLDRTSVASPELTTLVCLPMADPRTSRVLAVVHLVNKHQGLSFTDDDISLLETLLETLARLVVSCFLKLGEHHGGLDGPSAVTAPAPEEEEEHEEITAPPSQQQQQPSLVEEHDEEDS